MLIVLTRVVTAVVGRSVEADIAAFHGLLIGLFAAILGLTFGQFLATFVPTTAAGGVGGKSSHRFA